MINPLRQLQALGQSVWYCSAKSALEADWVLSGLSWMDFAMIGAPSTELSRWIALLRQLHVLLLQL